MIYGTAWKEDATTDLVIQAVTMGFKGIDTAGQPSHYQEHLVGAALKKLKEDHKIDISSLFIQTKFTPAEGQDPNNIPYDATLSLKEQVQ